MPLKEGPEVRLERGGETVAVKVFEGMEGGEEDSRGSLWGGAGSESSSLRSVL